MEDSKINNLIVDLLTKNSEDITEIKVTMERNTASLEEHIKRTNVLEDEVLSVKDDIKPLQKHVDMVNILFKASSALLLSAGSILAILNIFKLLS